MYITFLSIFLYDVFIDQSQNVWCSANENQQYVSDHVLGARLLVVNLLCIFKKLFFISKHTHTYTLNPLFNGFMI